MVSANDWRRSFFSFGAILCLVLIVNGSQPIPQPPCTTPPSADACVSSAEFLAWQGLALRPAFRDDLTQLQHIPRYQIDATVKLDTSVIEGTMQICYTNGTGAPLPDLLFRLYPNASTIYGGGSLDIQWVQRGDNQLAFSLTENDTALWVPLDPPLAPGKATTISMAFTAHVPTSGSQGYRIFHQGDAVTSLAGWYPILSCYCHGWKLFPIPAVGDAILTDPSFHDVRLTVPATHTVVATGTTLDRQETNEGVVWRVVSGPARSLTVILSDRYLSETVEMEGVTINYYALAASRSNTTRHDALSMARDAFATYTRRFGPYPFTEFDVVETAVSIGGYEFTGMVALEHTSRLRDSVGQFRFLVAHEVAHQWWYSLVGNNQILDPWLDESLSTYATALYLEDTLGPSNARALLATFERTYGRPNANTAPIDSSTLDFGSWATYRAPIYYHGALFLHALRQEMGDELFFTLLSTYYQRYRYQTATTLDFLQLAQETAGKDLTPLYQSWFTEREPWRAGGPSEE